LLAMLRSVSTATIFGSTTASKKDAARVFSDPSALALLSTALGGARRAGQGEGGVAASGAALGWACGAKDGARGAQPWVRRRQGSARRAQRWLQGEENRARGKQPWARGHLFWTRGGKSWRPGE